MAEKSRITIGIMSPGDMGHSFGHALLASDEEHFRIITNLTGRSKRTQNLSNSAGIIDVKTDEELVRQADFIFSILVPSEATALAQRFAPFFRQKQHIIYVELNAIAPQTLHSIASLFPLENFVDGCIIGVPPRSKEDSPSLCLSGEQAQKVADLFRKTDLIKVRVINKELGQASALKMCFASLSKGVTAITIQSAITAKFYGLDQVLFEELKERLPQILNKMTKSIPEMAPKAARWVGEMEEIAQTYAHIGLSEKLFQGAADTYRFVAEQTPLGNEIIEDRKLGQTLDDALEIMSQSLVKNHKV